MAEALFAAARQPKELWLVPGAAHGDFAQVAGPQWGHRLAAFFTHALVTGA
jgi:fermentation-respiration switch protein FrsA (DUF1100 family)